MSAHDGGPCSSCGFVKAPLQGHQRGEVTRNTLDCLSFLSAGGISSDVIYAVVIQCSSSGVRKPEAKEEGSSANSTM